MSLGRVAGYYAVALVTLLLPEAGDGRFWVAVLLAFLFAPIAFITSLKIGPKYNTVADPMVDLVTMSVIVAILPEYWIYGLLIGIILTLAPSIALNEFNHWFFSVNATYLLASMSVVGWYYSVPDWFIAIGVLIAVYPPTLFYSVGVGSRSRQMREKAEALAALRLVSGGIAHDFNNLLTGIAGYADFARSGTADPNGVEQALTRIISSTDRASQLTNQLILFAGNKKLEMRPVNLVREIKGVTESVEGSLPTGIQLDLQVPDEPVFVFGDPVQISQVLLNLVINGVEAIPDDGRVFIRLRSENEQAILEIEDTGIGIELDRQTSIFEPFETSKASGHGLGLAVVKNIVKDHRGDIRVISKLKQGTTFTVLFPLSSVAIGDDVTSTSGDPTLVLIADDEPAIRLILRQLLEAEGYSVIEASNGDEFLNMFTKHESDLCAVILDVKMPGRTGWQCLEEVRKTSIDLPVLMISGYDPEGPILDAPDRALRFLAKPFRIADVKNTLAKLISARSS